MSFEMDMPVCLLWEDTGMFVMFHGNFLGLIGSPG